MQLTRIRQLTGILVLKTGLHIGAGDTEMRIGGTGNPVVKNPLDGQPCVPGSSLKGKVRSLLEWQLGLVTATNGHPFSFQHLAKQDTAATRDLLRLFGGAPDRYLEIYEAVVGRNHPSLDKARKAMKHGLDPTQFEQKRSKINRYLAAALSLASTPYKVSSRGKRPYTRYGLELMPERISIE